MKLMTPEEIGRKESTKATIEKWDEFLKKAVWNLGYKQDIIDRMYPYQRGVPMKDGTFLPVNPDTGRVWFKMSTADKLAGLLSALSSSHENDCDPHAPRNNFVIRLGLVMLRLWRRNKPFFMAMFHYVPEEEAEAGYNELLSNTEDFDKATDLQELARHFRDTIIDQPQDPINAVFLKYWSLFIDNSDFVISDACTGCNFDRLFSSHFEHIKDAIKHFKNSVSMHPNHVNRYVAGNMWLRYKPFEDYDYKLSAEMFCLVLESFGLSTSASKIRNFYEVYLQDYLVISLNPIDKLMCSTKQAFGSCMSIAKQNESRGTQSFPAFGLPVLFQSDSTFLTFMTSGVHKKMYWSSEEWEKPAPERNEDEAYKYIKMTCRALTYQGAPHTECKEILEACKEEMRCMPEDHDEHNVLEAVKDNLFNADNDRLYIGRQYASAGEDYSWPPMIEWLLGFVGVSTSYAYLDEYLNLRYWMSGTFSHQKMRQAGDSGFKANARSLTAYSNWLKQGVLKDSDVAAIDRFDQLRTIYYDNITLMFDEDIRSSAARDSKNRYRIPEGKSLFKGNPHINVGSSRRGTGGATSFRSTKPGLDMFEIMTGRQDPSYMYSWLKICPDCGEIIAEGVPTIKYHDRNICPVCAERLELKKCPSCRKWYAPSEAAEHEMIAIKSIMDPDHEVKEEDTKTCLSTLQELADDRFRGRSICGQCGQIIKYPAGMFGVRFNAYKEIEYKGMTLRISLCDECLRKAVVCDKCKRVTFLDNGHKPVILLSGRRIICPDCIDTIRAKQKEKDALKQVVELQANGDIPSGSGELYLPLTDSAEKDVPNLFDEVSTEDRGYFLADIDKASDTIRKNVCKQFISLGEAASLPF